MSDEDSEVEVLEPGDVFAHRHVPFQKSGDGDDSDDSEDDLELLVPAATKKKAKKKETPKCRKRRVKDGEESPPKKNKATPTKGQLSSTPRRSPRRSPIDSEKKTPAEAESPVVYVSDSSDEEATSPRTVYEKPVAVKEKALRDLEKELEATKATVRPTKALQNAKELLKRQVECLSGINATLHKSTSTPAEETRSTPAVAIEDPRIARLREKVIKLKMTATSETSNVGTLRRTLSVSMNAHKKVQELVDTLTSRCPKGMKVVSMVVKVAGKPLDPSETLAESVYMIIGNGPPKLDGKFTMVVERDIPEGVAQDSLQSLAPPPGSFMVIVQSGPKSEVSVPIHMDEPLSKLFLRYAKEKNHDPSRLRFTLDGDTLQGTETCADVDLEEGVRLDVKLVV